MSYEILEEVHNWESVFEKARSLLLEGELTAIAVVSESEYQGGEYVATYLAEFDPMTGCMDSAIDNLEELAPMLYDERHSFRLEHGKFTSVSPYKSEQDWMLVIIYK